MALKDTGERVADITGVRARAKDDDQYVIVWTSDEAITDYGWDAIWAVADKKYAAKDYEESEDGARTVRVQLTTVQMPKGPCGEKRPADAIGRAAMIGKIATGEID